METIIATSKTARVPGSGTTKTLLADIICQLAPGITGRALPTARGIATFHQKAAIGKTPLVNRLLLADGAAGPVEVQVVQCVRICTLSNIGVLASAIDPSSCGKADVADLSGFGQAVTVDLAKVGSTVYAVDYAKLRLKLLNSGAVAEVYGSAYAPLAILHWLIGPRRPMGRIPVTYAQLVPFRPVHTSPWRVVSGFPSQRK